MDRMAGAPEVVTEDTEYCYGHPKTPTKLHCSRCDRPICGRCAIPASVGQHCPECVAEARKSAPKVRSAMQATAPVVMTILVINVVVFVLQYVIPGFTENFAMFPGAIANGEYWRLITPVFMHSQGFIFHIIMNCYILYSLGPNVEQAFGSGRFAVIYLAAGFMGNVLSFVMPPNVGSLGASGAVFGVAGVLLIYLFRRRRSAFVAQYLRSIVFFIGINLAFGFLFPGIDNWAHIGGLIAGIILGLGFDRDDALKPVTTALSTLAVVAGGILLVLMRL